MHITRTSVGGSRTTLRVLDRSTVPSPTGSRRLSLIRPALRPFRSTGLAPLECSAGGRIVMVGHALVPVWRSVFYVSTIRSEADCTGVLVLPRGRSTQTGAIGCCHLRTYRISPSAVENTFHLRGGGCCGPACNAPAALLMLGCSCSAPPLYLPPAPGGTFDR